MENTRKPFGWTAQIDRKQNWKRIIQKGLFHFSLNHSAHVHVTYFDLESCFKYEDNMVWFDNHVYSVRHLHYPSPFWSGCRFHCFSPESPETRRTSERTASAVNRPEDKKVRLNPQTDMKVTFKTSTFWIPENSRIASVHTCCFEFITLAFHSVFLPLLYALDLLKKTFKNVIVQGDNTIIPKIQAITST